MPMISPMLGLAEPAVFALVSPAGVIDNDMLLFYLLSLDPGLWIWGWY